MNLVLYPYLWDQTCPFGPNHSAILFYLFIIILLYFRNQTNQKTLLTVMFAMHILFEVYILRWNKHCPLIFENEMRLILCLVDFIVFHFHFELTCDSLYILLILLHFTWNEIWLVLYLVVSITFYLRWDACIWMKIWNSKRSLLKYTILDTCFRN